jgi:hypothetical protein
MGGHIEYPKPTNSTIYIYYDRIELQNPDLVIPYQLVNNIENMDEKKISAKRVVGLGLVAFPLAIVGAMWKKNHIYTIIQYRDDVGEKIIILDFGDKVDIIQSWIYHRMLSSRRSTTLIIPQGEFTVYENREFGFKIKYPQSWIRDEIEQKNEDYTTVVEFRKKIEGEPPFVTVYVNNLEPDHSSFKDFVIKETLSSQNDPNISILESIDLEIANMPAAKLVDVEYNDRHGGYKRMVVWISATNVVYEISYSTDQKRYPEYLPIVEKMLSSFQFVETKYTGKGNNYPKSESDDEDPLSILKKRFAKGELKEEEYLRMRKILES